MSKPKRQKTQTIDQFFLRQTASNDNNCESVLRQREIEIAPSTSSSNFRSTEMEHQNTAASLSQTQENPGPINDISRMQRKLPF
jgi:hypothetical protein